MTEAELKKKLRDLKRFELRTRYGVERIERAVLSGPAGEEGLVWERFFSLGSGKEHVRYPFSILRILDHESRKRIFDEFFTFVYFRKFAERGIDSSVFFDPELLEFLGLDFSADTADIKRRFRELAQQYHPDHGGDVLKMVELLEKYRSINH